jgi:ABC-type uncharacterized transport system ATPase subunit
MSLEVQKGEILGFLGRTRRETTTMRIITGYMPRRAGLFAWMASSSHSTSMCAPYWLSSKITFVPGDNVAGYLRLLQRSKAFLGIVSTVKWRDMDRPTSSTSERIAKLSKDTQKVGIAQARLASILILDEPPSVSIRNKFRSARADQRTGEITRS